MTHVKRKRLTTRATVETVARELTLQEGRDEGLWELMRSKAAALCIKNHEKASALVRAYNTRKRQGASAH